MMEVATNPYDSFSIFFEKLLDGQIDQIGPIYQPDDCFSNLNIKPDRKQELY
jgi:hypothetical protein